MYSGEEVVRSCHRAQSVTAWWWWGAFDSKRGTEDTEPYPTYHRISQVGRHS